MNTAYKFDYQRADGKMTAVGPFLESDEAESGKKEMEEMGAVCGEVYPVMVRSEDYQLLKAKKLGYIKKLLKEFEIYLDRELAVLDADLGYYIVYYYLKELRQRVRRFVKNHAPSKSSNGELIRSSYLQGVVNTLNDRANFYSPMDGSVPEDIGKLLRELAKRPL